MRIKHLLAWGHSETETYHTNFCLYGHSNLYMKASIIIRRFVRSCKCSFCSKLRIETDRPRVRNMNRPSPHVAYSNIPYFRPCIYHFTDTWLTNRFIYKSSKSKTCFIITTVIMFALFWAIIVTETFPQSVVGPDRQEISYDVKQNVSGQPFKT
jgi:hypothetical protein